MFINSFVEELSKKIDTVKLQLDDFQKKMDKIKEVKNLLALKTLKELDDLKGEDLVLLDEKDFIKILDVFQFDDIEARSKMFFNAKVAIKLNQKLLADGQVEINNINNNDNINWLDKQVYFIKEYIDDFNNNNKEYYNSLKISDSLYKKYYDCFNDGKLIKPIYDIDEFNEVLKKSGLLISEKWQLLKYVSECNLKFKKKEDSKNKEIIYSDEEILCFAEGILSRESNLIHNITEEDLKIAFEYIDYDDEKLNSLNLDKDRIIYLQKVPILNALDKLYNDTRKLLINEEDEDAKKIEDNFKDMLKLIDSYDVIKKLNK